MKRNDLKRLMISALLLAVGLVLPFLTGQLGSLGTIISPLHIPAFICGLTCGPVYGAVMGFVLPLFRSLIFGMPPFPAVALPMAFEVAAYGCVSGLMYPLFCRLLRNKTHLLSMVIAMLIAMVAGRLLGGAAKAVMMGIQGNAYSLETFLQAYFVSTAPGALIHLILCPAIVAALEQAKLSPVGNQLPSGK